MLPLQPLILSERVAAYHVCAALQGAFFFLCLYWTPMYLKLSEDVLLGKKLVLQLIIILERFDIREISMTYGAFILMKSYDH